MAGFKGGGRARRPTSPFPSSSLQPAYAPRAAPGPPPTVGEVSAASLGPQSTGARVTLVGRAGAPFELASFGAGGDRVRATSSIAFSVGRDKTEWIPVDVWGPLATAVAGAVAKGDRIHVVGRLRASEFADKATGAKRRSVRVVADAVSMVVDGPGGGGYGGGGDASSQVPADWGTAPASASWGAAAAPAPVDAGWPAAAPDAGGGEWGAPAAAAAPPAWGAAAPDAAAAGGAAAPPPAAAPWDGEAPATWGEPAPAPAAAWGAAPAAPGPPPPGAASPGDEKWAPLFANPAAYWDNRVSKRSPRGPDFKHKATGDGLWLSSRDTPRWVADRLGELPPPPQA